MQRRRRVLGRGRRLRVVAEAGEVEVDRHLLRQLRRGGAGGDEERLRVGRHRRRREHGIRVAQPEYGRDMVRDQVAGARREHRGVAFAVDREQLDSSAEHPAGAVDLLHGERRPVARGDVERLLGAGEIEYTSESNGGPLVAVATPDERKSAENRDREHHSPAFHSFSHSFFASSRLRSGMSCICFITALVLPFVVSLPFGVSICCCHNSSGRARV